MGNDAPTGDTARRVPRQQTLSSDVAVTQRDLLRHTPAPVLGDTFTADDDNRSTSSGDEARREALAEFLRVRRESLQPEDIGIPRRGRRRVRGLRRHEVADAAAMSVTWYTWLEQGRDIRATPKSLRPWLAHFSLTIASTATSAVSPA